MKLFAIADLCQRWQYTRAGVHKLVKTDGFPKPVAVVALGRTVLFSEADILAYESSQPQLLKKQVLQMEKVKNGGLKNKDWVTDI